jgi:hypothetical protein
MNELSSDHEPPHRNAIEGRPGAIAARPVVSLMNIAPNPELAAVVERDPCRTTTSFQEPMLYKRAAHWHSIRQCQLWTASVVIQAGRYSRKLHPDGEIAFVWHDSCLIWISGPNRVPEKERIPIISDVYEPSSAIAKSLGIPAIPQTLRYATAGRE